MHSDDLNKLFLQCTVATGWVPVRDMCTVTNCTTAITQDFSSQSIKDPHLKRCKLTETTECTTKVYCPIWD